MVHASRPPIESSENIERRERRSAGVIDATVRPGFAAVSTCGCEEHATPAKAAPANTALNNVGRFKSLFLSMLSYKVWTAEKPFFF
jgi:hypothetical protein